MRRVLIESILVFFIIMALFSISIAISYNIYPYASALLPMLWFLSEEQNRLNYILFILSIAALISIAYLLFVDYMNHPWFAGEDPFTCDGPCYGWYTFQRDIGDEIIINIIVLILSSIITIFIKEYIEKKDKE